MPRVSVCLHKCERQPNNLRRVLFHELLRLHVKPFICLSQLFLCVLLLCVRPLDPDMQSQNALSKGVYRFCMQGHWRNQ
jgi:hypothetical protein